MRKEFSFLNEQHAGSTAIETTILIPCMFGTFIMLLYMLFLALAYIAYGNVANNIAHQMNMRQTGYRQAVVEYPDYSSTRVQTSGVMSVDSGRYAEPGTGIDDYLYLNSNDIKFIVANDPRIAPNKYLRSGAYFALDIAGKNGVKDHICDQFILPYVMVNGITFHVSKPLDFDTSTGTRAAVNTMVMVTVDFTVMNPISLFNYLESENYTGGFSNLINISVNGYDVIA